MRVANLGKGVIAKHAGLEDARSKHLQLFMFNDMFESTTTSNFSATSNNLTVSEKNDFDLFFYCLPVLTNITYLANGAMVSIT